MARVFLRNLGLVAAASAFAVAAAAQQPTIEELAEQLREPPAAVEPEAPCEYRLGDGSCADVAETRQFINAAKVAAPAARAVRFDIQMSFLLNSADLTAQARATLDRFAARLLSIGSFRPFAVEGHTDSSGTREANQQLSRARAEAVVNYLAAKGVDRSKLVAQGYGYDRPLAGRSADDPANRRVEVVAR